MMLSDERIAQLNRESAERLAVWEELVREWHETQSVETLPDYVESNYFLYQTALKFKEGKKSEYTVLYEKYVVITALKGLQ